MGRWKPGETEFTVAVSKHGTRGAQCYVPKPVVDLLGDPDRLTFKSVDGVVSVFAAGGPRSAPKQKA